MPYGVIEFAGGTKPLHKPKLANHQWCLSTDGIQLKTFSQEMLKYSLVIYEFENYDIRLQSHFPGAKEVIQNKPVSEVAMATKIASWKFNDIFQLKDYFIEGTEMV